MAGRRAGTDGDLKATAYIAAEFKRLGLVPAGDSGTYYQYIPLVTYAYDTATPLQVGGHALRFGTDFVPISRRVPTFDRRRAGCLWRRALRHCSQPSH